MSDLESPSTLCQPATESLPRHSYREIAELLAMAIARARNKNLPELVAAESEVLLGFSADQSVNANPAYTEGVRK